MKVISIVGARPQFIKAAVLRNIFPKKKIKEVLIHTGQHYDHKMSEIFFDEFKMNLPEYYVDLKGRSHGAMTGEIISECEKILIKENPDFCLVYGDTNSTIAGALAASKLQIPICHVEAGLRSFNKKMPEEINRILTDHMSDLLFCSTHLAVKNLKNENIDRGVYHVGDIMYDAYKLFFKHNSHKDQIKKFLEPNKPLAMMTIHRQETIDYDENLLKVIEYCKKIGEKYSLVFPIHPRTKKKLAHLNIKLGPIKPIEPLSYSELHSMLSSCDLLLTDSGGMQKEAYFHRVRCITLRDETEWTETIKAGWNRLWTQENYFEQSEITEYGQGDCAEKIIDILIKSYSKNT